MGFMDKAKEMLGGKGVEKAGDAVDEKTGGQYEDQVDQGQEWAQGKLSEGGDEGGDGGQQQN